MSSQSGGGLISWLPNGSGSGNAGDGGGGIKNSVAAGNVLHIPTGYQYIVYRDFTADGTVIGDGDLVIL